MDLDVPFHDYPSTLRFLRGNLARRRDNWIGWEGPEGSGKSTGAMTLAMDLDPNFSVEKDCIFTVPQLLDVLGSGRKGELFLLDEAANIFYNRDWSTWEAKELTRIGRQMRVMESTWIVVMPDFDGLDPYIREKRIRTRIYQPPYYDSDGMTNGPAKVLWKTERFDYTEQRIVNRWVDVYDLEAHTLDGRACHCGLKHQAHPEMQSYNARKVDNFHGLVKSFQTRLRREQARDERRDEREARPRPGKRKAANQSPPTTT